MKFYLAGQWSRRDEIEGYAASLRADGHEVVSRWHSILMGDDHAVSEFNWREWANADLDDIFKADAFVAFMEPRGTMSRGGRHVEWGFALAAMKMRDGLMLIVGEEVESQFYALYTKKFRTFTELRQTYQPLPLYQP